MGCLFLLFKTPAVQATLTLLLLFPVVGSVVAAPIHWVIQKVKDSRMVVERERDRLGEYIFQEPGARTSAKAVADRDLARIKVALPNAGDINRIADLNLPYYVPLGDKETFLSFALKDADDSDACAAVVELLLSAGADPNLPHAFSIYRAMNGGTRVVEILLRAGADINVGTDSEGAPVWWSVLESGPQGTTDLTMLQFVLDHGADTTKRRSYGSPIEIAVEGNRWDAVAIFAPRVPEARDVVIGRYPNFEQEGEAVHVLLAREVKALQEANLPVPDGMRAALVALGVTVE